MVFAHHPEGDAYGGNRGGGSLGITRFAQQLGGLGPVGRSVLSWGYFLQARHVEYCVSGASKVRLQSETRLPFRTHSWPRVQKDYLYQSVVIERIETTWGSTGPTCVLGEAFRHGTGDEDSPKSGCQTAAASRVGSGNGSMLVHLRKQIDVNAKRWYMDMIYGSHGICRKDS